MKRFFFSVFYVHLCLGGRSRLVTAKKGEPIDFTNLGPYDDPKSMNSVKTEALDLLVAAWAGQGADQDSPDDADALFWTGWTLRRRGQSEATRLRALEFLGRAVTQKPNNPIARFHFGEALLDLGEVTRGVNSMHFALYNLTTSHDHTTTTSTKKKKKNSSSSSSNKHHHHHHQQEKQNKNHQPPVELDFLAIIRAAADEQSSLLHAAVQQGRTTSSISQQQTKTTSSSPLPLSTISQLAPHARHDEKKLASETTLASSSSSNTEKTTTTLKKKKYSSSSFLPETETTKNAQKDLIAATTASTTSSSKKKTTPNIPDQKRQPPDPRDALTADGNNRLDRDREEQQPALSTTLRDDTTPPAGKVKLRGSKEKNSALSKSEKEDRKIVRGGLSPDEERFDFKALERMRRRRERTDAILRQTANIDNGIPRRRKKRQPGDKLRLRSLQEELMMSSSSSL